MEIKSNKMKSYYDRKVRKISFVVGQKVWFYNSRRKTGKVPKLQSNWEGLYRIIKKLNDIVFCIQKSTRHRKKIVHADRLATSQ